MSCLFFFYIYIYIWQTHFGKKLLYIASPKMANPQGILVRAISDISSIFLGEKIMAVEQSNIWQLLSNITSGLYKITNVIPHMS